MTGYFCFVYKDTDFILFCLKKQPKFYHIAKY